MIYSMIALAGMILASTAANAAQHGTGPVAQNCKEEIEKFCAGKPHVARQVRTCLEENKAQLSSACKDALDTTGPGKGPHSKRN